MGIRGLLLLLPPTLAPCARCAVVGRCLGRPSGAAAVLHWSSPAVPSGVLLPLAEPVVELLLLLSVVAPSLCINSRVSLSRSVSPAAPAAWT